jgi:hypothetical protein
MMPRSAADCRQFVVGRQAASLRNGRDCSAQFTIQILFSVLTG